MPLTGQAKTDYQREYMRNRRSNQRSNVTPESVRPSATPDVRPLTKLFREECVTCEHLGGDENDKAICAVVDGRKCVHDEVKPEPQSYNSMMVGYVPPRVGLREA